MYICYFALVNSKLLLHFLLCSPFKPKTSCSSLWTFSQEESSFFVSVSVPAIYRTQTHPFDNSLFSFRRTGREGIFLEKQAAFYLAEIILALEFLHNLGMSGVAPWA